MEFKKAILIPLALSASACGAPNNTRPLTEEEQTQVSAAIDRERLNLAAVAPFLDYTNPFFDVYGDSISNNSILREQLDSNIEDLYTFLEEGRIVVAFDRQNEFQDNDCLASASGMYTASERNDYILLRGEPSDMVDSGWQLAPLVEPGVLIHERTHFDYGGHSQDVKHAGSDYEEMSNQTIEHHDSPYLAYFLSKAGNEAEARFNFLDEATYESDYQLYISYIESGFWTPQDAYIYLLERKSESQERVLEEMERLYSNGPGGIAFLRDYGGLSQEHYEQFIRENASGFTEFVKGQYQKLIERLILDYPDEIVINA